MRGTDDELLYASETFRIRGAIFEVQRTLGCGFLEAVYQESLALEFTYRGIPFVGLRPLDLRYKGQLLRQRYTPDFVCFDQIIVELKAVRELAPEHRAQLIHYLRATGIKVGLLVNFGSLKARVERVVLEEAQPSPSA
jgi:GxxExxY protein